MQVTKVSGTNDFLLQYSISTLTLTTLTVEYAGVNQGFSNATYGNVLINANSIQTGAGTGVVGGSFTIGTSGVFTPSTGGILSIAGNFSNSGSFAHDSGTVQIDGSGTSTLSGTGSPAITFHNFTVNTASKSLDFTAGQTFRVNGLLTLDNQNIDSTTASQWFINHQGTESVTNTTITNSGCDGSSTFITVDITDTNGGNNGSCWDFASVIYPNPVRLGGNNRIRGNVRIVD